MTETPRLSTAVLASRVSPGVRKPAYDRANVRAGMVHIGVGGFHRSHQAFYIDRWLNLGNSDLGWGICGVGLLDSDRAMRDALVPQDGLYTLTLRQSGVEPKRRVVGSIVEYLWAPQEPRAVFTALSRPATRLVSLTITEGGYNPDLTDGLEAPRSAFGFIVAGLAARRDRGIAPFSVLSCDNVSNNGDKTRSSVARLASRVDGGLADWILANVDFPNSMVDRITPATSQADRESTPALYGCTDEWPVVAEPFAQWVVEDSFRYGRPSLEAVGVQFVNEIDAYEAMKLRLLNATHQVLCHIATLQGYKFVDEAMRDPMIRGAVDSYLYKEALPVMGATPGIDARIYSTQVVARLANGEIRDTVARLREYASDRIPGFLLPVIRDNLNGSGSLSSSVRTLAAWRAWLRLGIPPVDHRKVELVHAAGDSDPTSFIRLPIFDGLANERVFREAFEAECAALG